MKNKLFELIKKNGIENLDKTLLNPEAMILIGPAILNLLENNIIDVDAVGGLAIEASPIVTAVSVSSSHLHRKLIHGFLIRGEIKYHGTGKIIEGYNKDEANVVLVAPIKNKDLERQVKIIRQNNMNVVIIVSIISDKFDDDILDIPTMHLFTMEEFE